MMESRVLIRVRVSRDVLEDLVGRLCPRLGPSMCGYVETAED